MPRWYGEFGGSWVPETLVPALEELDKAWARVRRDRAFRAEFEGLARDWGGRPSPLYHAENLSRELGGAQIWLKREDLVHGGAHKFNNALGQGLLARRLGKPRIIAETGAGQHGVATAMVGAKLGLATEVYMGAVDMERQRPNVLRMKLLGATVRPVDQGTRTLKDAINEALRDWITNVQTTHYLIGSAVGPHPFPSIVAELQSVIGREILRESRRRWGEPPDLAIACVGGGSNAIGTFRPLLRTRTRLVGVEAAGPSRGPGTGAASLGRGRPGVLHGMRTYLLQDGEGQILPTESVAAGLDYAAVGPEHAFLKESGRVEYTAVHDEEALEAFRRLARSEGILPALEPSHALAEAIRQAPTLSPDQRIVVTLSGRGDKDLEEVGRHGIAP
jgi:tryptophan synthase beta chain